MDYGTEGASADNFELLVYGLNIPGNYTVKVTAKSGSNATISKSIEIVISVGLSLVWSDEFNGSGAVNSTNWFHQTQLPNGTSWYNGELQH